MFVLRYVCCLLLTDPETRLYNFDCKFNPHPPPLPHHHHYHRRPGATLLGAVSSMWPQPPWICITPCQRKPWIAYLTHCPTEAPCLTNASRHSQHQRLTAPHRPLSLTPLGTPHGRCISHVVDLLRFLVMWKPLAYGAAPYGPASQAAPCGVH